MEPLIRSKHRVLAVTLARGGSKGIPGKNIRSLAGEPLLAYTIAEAKRSKLITRYVVSTDSEDIRSVAREYGAEAPFLRPAELAGDTATSLDALKHAVLWAEAEEKRRYDYVVELMCTNPFKDTADIDGAIEKLIRTGAESVIGLTRLWDHHPARVKRIVDDRLVDFTVPEPANNRRQDLTPAAYIRNGSIYAMRRDVLIEQNARFGTVDSRPYIMTEEKSLNCDTPLDFEIAEAMLKKRPRDYVGAPIKR